MKLDYEGLGRDLYAEKVSCNCPNPDYKHDPELASLLPTKIRLSGYADDNFFDNVNKEPREGQCSCGRKFKYQWFRTHVDFEWVG